MRAAKEILVHSEDKKDYPAENDKGGCLVHCLVTQMILNPGLLMFLQVHCQWRVARESDPILLSFTIVSETVNDLEIVDVRARIAQLLSTQKWTRRLRELREVQLGRGRLMIPAGRCVA
ncbi:hypothetical protein ACHWQZ_G004093 [Mnemiopsis leidyi]